MAGSRMRWIKIDLKQEPSTGFWRYGGMAGRVRGEVFLQDRSVNRLNGLYEHGVVVCPDGDIMMFDNGHYRSKLKAHYSKAKDSYSRGVRYHIDREARTIGTGMAV